MKYIIATVIAACAWQIVHAEDDRIRADSDNGFVKIDKQLVTEVQSLPSREEQARFLISRTKVATSKSDIAQTLFLLGQVKTPEAVDVIIQNLARGDVCAEQVIVKYCSKEAFPKLAALVEKANSPDEPGVWTAINAMRQIYGGWSGYDHWKDMPNLSKKVREWVMRKPVVGWDSRSPQVIPMLVPNC